MNLEIYVEYRIYRISVKGYGFLSFVKSIGAHATKVAKSMSKSYSQKRIVSAKKFTTDAIRTAFKKSNSKNCISNCWFNW